MINMERGGENQNAPNSFLSASSLMRFCILELWIVDFLISQKQTSMARCYLLLCSVGLCFADSMSCSTENVTAVDEPCSALQIVTRAQWGARAPVQVNTLPVPVGRAFIHHTAMAQCTDLESCSAQMRSIQNFHMDQRGWWDIGYSFLIGGDGRVYEGRGWDSEGAHTRGFNSVSLAVSLMGNFAQEPPSEVMLDTSRRWIDCGKQLGKMTQEVRVSGHRDAGCTECPGEALYRIIETWPDFQKGPLPGYICRSSKKN